MKPTREWLCVGAIGLALAGCGGESQPEEGTDPETVSKDFVQAVAEANPEACELMTSRAEREAQVVGGGGTCEEGIEKGRFARNISYGSPPAELANELDSGELEETREGMAFRFCVPNETEITLDLVQVDREWRVELVSAGRKEFFRGGVDVSPPCEIR